MTKQIQKIQSYGQRIRQRRRELDKTQEQLAQELGVTRAHLSNIERGTVHASVVLLQQIETQLAISLVIAEKRPITQAS